MHPQISHFPRHIFYGGQLLDGPNVRNPDYGNPLVQTVSRSVAMFRPFTILNLDSREEKAGTSMSNPAEAQLAVYLFQQLKQFSRGLSTKSRVAVITPYAQQSRLLKQTFADALGPTYDKAVEVNTVDAFQGREANIVIFSAVRASGSRGVGFLADVRRMNVALTRAKHFLFVIARVESIVQNPYWNDLVQHARQTGAVVHVPVHRNRGSYDFGMVSSWHSEAADPRALQIASRESGLPPIKSGPSMDPRRAGGSVKIPPPPPGGPGKNGSVTKDPRMRTDHIKKPKPADPRRKISDPRSLPRDPRKDHAGEGSRPADPRKRK
jgi:senataxin